MNIALNNNPNKINFENIEQNLYEAEVLEYAQNCFKHLIPKGKTIQSNEFIKLIESSYNKETPQTKEVIRLLTKYQLVTFTNPF